jgi:hypothetical protein
MADRKSSRTGTGADAEALKGDLPERFAEAQEKGYFGTVPDQPPNEAYTLAGVTSSDEAAQHDARLGGPLGDAEPADGDDDK